MEEREPFLSLFPHRFDYIYAEHPQPNASPSWQTERRYPLSDRLIQQGHSLYGVRFGAQTNYCLLDIDAGSTYHPQKDELAISRIVAALEAIGVVGYLACTSSYSGGLHLYFPFPKAQNSWELAAVVSALLENAGFVITPGQLEVFPNPKPYVVQGKPSLFNAHRLPLQAGSYLLDRNFQPIWGNQAEFVQQWRSIESRNSVDRLTLKRIAKQARRRRFCISGKADKFINDLNAEIELGWTGTGQTNRLLGRITMRAYIFHHLIAGGPPLSGEALVKEIVRTAESLPGYQEWCNHQHEIEQRAEEWARCIESSRYFHYGDAQGKYKTQKLDTELDDSISKAAITALPSWNQQQLEAARERIRSALAKLLEENTLPPNPTQRFHALRQYGIGGATLYRHRDLWHPAESSELSMETLSMEESVTGNSFLNHSAPDSLFPASDRLLSTNSSFENLFERLSDFKNLAGSAGSDFKNSAVEDRSLEAASVPSAFKDYSSTSIDIESQQNPTSLFPQKGGNVLTSIGFSDLILQYVTQKGSNAALPVRSNVDRSLDQTDLSPGISLQIRCLGWMSQQASDRGLARFGNQQQVPSEAELWQWLKESSGLWMPLNQDSLSAFPTASCRGAPAGPSDRPDISIAPHLPIEKLNPPDYVRCDSPAIAVSLLSEQTDSQSSNTPQ